LLRRLAALQEGARAVDGAGFQIGRQELSHRDSYSAILIVALVKPVAAAIVADRRLSRHAYHRERTQTRD
jgi:hypothetical protein